MRSYGWENTLRTLLFDIRFAARQLRRNPGFTAVSALTLAIGIGASTAIFSAINPILFKPLPYPEPSRLLMIWNTWQGARSELAFGTWLELSQRSHSLASSAIFEPWQPAMTGAAHPERLNGQSVSASFFPVLGVAPVLGRDFRPSEQGPNAPRAVILSDALWRRLFHADPSILGRSVKLDGDLYTVVGLMPRSFEDVLSPAAELWAPEQYDSTQLTREFNTWAWGNHLRMIARVRPGVTREHATQELGQIARTPWPQFPRPAGRRSTAGSSSIPSRTTSHTPSGPRCWRSSVRSFLCWPSPGSMSSTWCWREAASARGSSHYAAPSAHRGVAFSDSSSPRACSCPSWEACSASCWLSPACRPSSRSAPRSCPA
ncbi:MAG TPA: ABC transporter permease [Acidobacteriaceae bacterium]